MKQQLQSYLNTKTILVIDSNEDWQLLYPIINKEKYGYTADFFKNKIADYKDISLDLSDYCWAPEKWYKIKPKDYKDYKFIHSKNIINMKKFRLWKLNSKIYFEVVKE